jgi:hypothetical protein
MGVILDMKERYSVYVGESSVASGDEKFCIILARKEPYARIYNTFTGVELKYV